MIFRRLTPHFLSALTPLTAADFPLVPRSSRILTVPGVKRFWIDRLGGMPSHGAGASRAGKVTDEIRSGRHDVAARLVCLSHNVEAWARQGNMEQAEKTQRRLLSLRRRLAGFPARGGGRRQGPPEPERQRR